MDSGYSCGAVNDSEAQGLHAHQPVAIGAFCGVWFGRGKVGAELKADSQIMGQNRQLQPCAVGGVVVGRDGVQREFALELGKGLLLSSAASDEVPQCARAECEVSGDRRILEVAVIGGEEIELVIAPALVTNALAKDHDPQLQLPDFKLKLGLEAGDLGLHRRPVLLRGDRSAHSGPFGLIMVSRGRDDKKALLVVTDGMDNASSSSLDQVVAQARRQGLLVYSIGIGDPNVAGILAFGSMLLGAGDIDQVDAAPCRLCPRRPGPRPS